MALKCGRFFTSHFRAIGARKIFPCWDEPSFKATFNISIKHHQNYTAFSNTWMKTSKEPEDVNRNITPSWYYDNDIENETQWTHFAITSEIPTYLVAFLMRNDIYNGKIDKSSVQPLSVNEWVMPYLELQTELKFAKDVAENITAVLSKNYTYTHIPRYRYIQHIVVPFLPYSNAKWGFFLYR